MPSIVQSLVLVFSRLLIQNPSKVMEYLRNASIEGRPALKILIDKWLLHQPLFRGVYFKNISIMALAQLYALKNEIVESLMVIGYDPSHKTASVEVNAPLKILSILLRCLKNEILQVMIKEKKTNIDDMDVDGYLENDDTGGKDDELYDNEQERENSNELRTDEIIDSTKNDTGVDNTGADIETDKIDVGLDEFKDLEKEEQAEIQANLKFFVNFQYYLFRILKEKETV